MTQVFHIREARPADAAGVARVQVESWHTTFRGRLPEDFLAEIKLERRVSRWEESLNDPARAEEELVFVAEAGAGEVVGFASGGREREGDAEFDGELYAIYLLEAFQRRGLGRRLMLAVVEGPRRTHGRARARGAHAPDRRLRLARHQAASRPTKGSLKMRGEEARDTKRATDGPPPFGGSWATLYALVLANLAVLVLLFYLFTRAFR